MGLFSRKKETRNFVPLFQNIYGTGLFAAERNLAVDNAVSIIANTISTLPIKLYTYTKSGHTEAWWNPVSRLLKDPAVEETALLFYKTLVRHILLSGNGFVFMHKHQDQVLSLEIIDPSYIQVRRSQSGRKIFQITGERGGVYSENEVIHIPYSGEGYNGTFGQSPVNVHKNAIKRNDLIAEYIAVFFNNGIGSRLLVELDKDDYKAGSPKMEKLLQEFTQYFNTFVLGPANANRPIITPPSTKITKIEQGNNQQAQVLDLYRESCSEIYRIFNVPPEVINSSESKYNSLEAKNADFLNLCIRPLCMHITGCLEKSLLVPGSREYIEYDWSSLLETDPAKKAEYELKLFHGGAITLNELRSSLNYSAVENEVEGNTKWIPSNLVPLTEDNINAYLAKSKAELIGTAEKQEDKELEGHNMSGRDMNL